MNMVAIFTNPAYAPDKRPSLQTTFSAPSELHDRMVATAKEHGIPVAELVREAITEFLDGL
jgi:predicted DNA-binding protein